MPISIDIDDFPDELPVYVDTTYRLRLDRKAKGEIKELLSKNAYRWKNGVSNLGNLNPYCVPLGFYKKLLEKLNMPLSELSGHILFYGDPRGITVNSPKIPIMNTPEFNEVFAHLLGDGSRSGRYEQKTFLSVREFLDEVNRAFGTLVQKSKTLDITTHRKTDGRIFYRAQIPLAIIRILEKKYRVKFGTYSGFIPKELMNGPKENLMAILRAFLIDEGNISDHIAISSFNKNILSGLSEICKALGIRCGVYEDTIVLYDRDKLLSLLPLSIEHKHRLLESYEILKKDIKVLDTHLRYKRILHHIIKNHGINSLNLKILTNEASTFYNIINDMKNKGLVTRKNKKYTAVHKALEFMKIESTREKILVSLNKGPLSANKIAELTNRHVQTIYGKQMKKLEKHGYVRREYRGNNEYLWFLTAKGKKVAKDISSWNSSS